MPLTLVLTPADLLTPAEATTLESTYAAQLAPALLSVDVTLLTSTEMRALNLAQRGIDTATDVLSFPNFEPELLSSLQYPREAILPLGSIAICAEKALEYQESHAELVHHGLLHLLGYDHETDVAAWDVAEAPLITAMHARNLPVRSRHDLQRSL